MTANVKNIQTCEHEHTKALPSFPKIIEAKKMSHPPTASLTGYVDAEGASNIIPRHFVVYSACTVQWTRISSLSFFPFLYKLCIRNCYHLGEKYVAKF
jgi:hypothetical protein